MIFTTFNLFKRPNREITVSYITNKLKFEFCYFITILYLFIYFNRFSMSATCTPTTVS